MLDVYFTTDAYNFVVSKENRDGAIGFLENPLIYGLPSNAKVDVGIDELCNGCFTLEPELNPFSGYDSYDGSLEIEEFLKGYCEPGSFVSQRVDDYFEYSIIWLDETRSIVCEVEDFQNPFIGKMHELRETSMA